MPANNPSENVPYVPAPKYTECKDSQVTDEIRVIVPYRT